MNKGERTKRFIIEHSSALFNKLGYRHTSISDIMTATGLKKGGIYNHFQNKDVLAKASFSHSVNVLRNKYLEAVNSKDTSYEQFDAFIEVFRSLFSNNVLVGGCPLMNAAIEADDTPIDFEDSIKEGFTGLVTLISGIIEKGKLQNEIKGDIEVVDTAKFILSTLEGALALSRLYQDKDYLELAIKQIKKLLFI
ncbi:TetR/AcrR family transcriptional regulator [Robertmurraya yapensis]|uniref:TetR/AcrR family transcriptional regulator n=2 Tax=Bacillaceae TaxID=186817 RepID=A0A431W4M0_9BACI|nr:TetR/AcrR family transcriptional regulator [Bacillus yapensis]RTR30395.1 TetR/AcrR family transcriptional regulator [Bacillus yapensis]TKS95214.1 TetR family transcriptional regulator [Bacillus yapensis]